MFSFFHRTPVIHVDCFTADNNAYKFTPVIPALQARPEWFDQITKPNQTNTKFKNYVIDDNGYIDFNNDFSNRTLRSCYGFLEYYKKGFIIENWCDLAVDVTNAGISYHYSTGKEPIIHKEIQTSPGYTNHYILKLCSPWIVQTKEDVQFLAMGTEWSFEKYNFRILPGVVNFHYQTSTNAFLTIKKGVPDQFQVPMGQPMVHFIPLTDKRIEIHNHIVTEQEIKTKTYNETGTAGGWRRTVGLVRRNDKRQSKCPFGE